MAGVDNKTCIVIVDLVNMICILKICVEDEKMIIWLWKAAKLDIW